MTAGQSAGPGPRVVAVGGGHGLAATLRAVRPWAGSITAVVSVADDGGSSGRLRAEMEVVPPGDLRRCLAALADAESPLGQALEHRFVSGSLAGHAVGNLLIVGLAEAGGDLVAALDEVGRLVGAAGRVLPAAVEPVVLMAGGANGAVEGQSRVGQSTGLRRVGLRPSAPASPPAVAAALAAADLVVLGPGSLLTSLLATCVVPAVAEALATTAAIRVLVGNLGPQPGETEGLDADEHLAVLADHGVPVDVVVADPRFAPSTAAVPLVVEPIGDPERNVHDPDRLGAVLAGLVGPADA